MFGYVTALRTNVIWEQHHIWNFHIMRRPPSKYILEEVIKAAKGINRLNFRNESKIRILSYDYILVDKSAEKNL